MKRGNKGSTQAEPVGKRPTQLSLTVGADELEAVKKTAKATDRSLAGFVRYALRVQVQRVQAGDLDDAG